VGGKLRIALIGGTGHQGPGLALRWALAGHEVLIGSRRAEKAERVAGELRERIRPGTVVVSPVVPIVKADFGLTAELPPEGSAAELIASLLPQARVVAAFHTVAANLLLKVPEPVEGDVVVCGDDREAKRTVMDLVRDIPELRPLDGGPLAYSRVLEMLTPLLITMGKRMGQPDLGVKFI